MKLGFGLYKHMLDDEHFRFARQCGATHLVVHLVDYFRKGGGANPASDQPMGDRLGWGLAGDPDRLWTAGELADLRRRVEAHGLTLHAIENFDPAHWSEILLDGPGRARHVENVRTILRNVGAAGIPVMGYNFSIAGVYGRSRGSYARGGAEAVGMEGVDGVGDVPMPEGMVWNMRLRDGLGPGVVEGFPHEELWRRLAAFLHDVLPVAEEAGVRLALHPDDPPLPTLRGTPRLVYQPSMYDRVLDISPSPSNALEYCLGTLTEMTGRGESCEAVYDALDRHAARGAIGYVHLRNVRGVVPHYREVFIDEGDLDVPRALRILADRGFDGVIIPDHAPSMSCPAPWHAGMAFAMGYLKAELDRLRAPR